jgi:hypothetical protein
MVRLRGSIVVTFEMMRGLDDLIVVVFFGIFRLGLNQSVRSLKNCRAKIGSMTDFSWIGSPKLHLGYLF